MCFISLKVKVIFFLSFDTFTFALKELRCFFALRLNYILEHRSSIFQNFGWESIFCCLSWHFPYDSFSCFCSRIVQGCPSRPKTLKMQEHCQLVNHGSRAEDLCCPETAIDDELSVPYWIVFWTRFGMKA